MVKLQGLDIYIFSLEHLDPLSISWFSLIIHGGLEKFQRKHRPYFSGSDEANILVSV